MKKGYLWCSVCYRSYLRCIRWKQDGHKRT
nr:MAG TPA: hypothetical protein [Caudoviricetes sp.]